MNKQAVSEIKKRYKKDKVSFKKIAGCYVDENKNKVCTFTRSFLNLEDDEIFRYLEIANKTLSGKIKDNLLTVEFPIAEENSGVQSSLLAIRDDEFNNEQFLANLYDRIIETYDTVSHYLILLFLDTIDVTRKASDKTSLDDSDEVYSYILCSICPVELSKPGLSYQNDENDIRHRTRDWVVSAPETGFLFPSFTDRTTNIHEFLFYTKNTKEPHIELFDDFFHCPYQKTSTQIRESISDMIKNEIGEDNDLDGKVIDIQYFISEQQDKYHEEYGDNEEFVITEEVIRAAIEDKGIAKQTVERIVSDISDTYDLSDFSTDDLVSSSSIKEGKHRAEKHALEDALDNKIREAEAFKHRSGEAIYISGNLDNSSIVNIDGKRYLCIDDFASLYINGENI